MDELDLDLVAALQYAPRAPSSALAEVLDSSPSTVGRRLQRLQSSGRLRVVGQLDWSLVSDAHPRHMWLHAESGRAVEVARRLARMPETQLVALSSGRADIYCVVHPAERARAAELLTTEIPSVEGVRGTQSDLVLRPVTRADAWTLDRLPVGRLEALRPYRTHVPEPDEGAVASGPLSDDEIAVVGVLHADARVGSGDMARELGVSQSTAYRLVQSLLERGVVRPRVEVEPERLGMHLEVILSLTVRPGAIAHVAEKLSAHPSARYVSVVAGEVSLIHHGAFRDERELGRFITEDLAALPGIADVRSSVLLEVLRRYWIDRDKGLLGEARLPFTSRGGGR
ncbi:Lrp/AsnC family transcriptional regulator [Nocardiopsis baichengensis]|uniref:Lrp/AsnC family transcriptional regulator n=1 Tax=Nocardiopsis baichengensis TaxID=280240 RepID=UPI00036409CC|nr:Lrp/AsnC family transcriptional regulator [Nocardiopsis baichengensis]